MGSLRQGEKQKQRQEQRNKETSNTLWHKRTVYLRIFQDMEDCVGGKYHNCFRSEIYPEEWGRYLDLL